LGGGGLGGAFCFSFLCGGCGCFSPPPFYGEWYAARRTPLHSWKVVFSPGLLVLFEVGPLSRATVLFLFFFEISFSTFLSFQRRFRRHHFLFLRVVLTTLHATGLSDAPQRRFFFPPGRECGNTPSSLLSFSILPAEID